MSQLSIEESIKTLRFLGHSVSKGSKLCRSIFTVKWFVDGAPAYMTELSATELKTVAGLIKKFNGDEIIFASLMAKQEGLLQ